MTSDDLILRRGDVVWVFITISVQKVLLSVQNSNHPGNWQVMSLLSPFRAREPSAVVSMDCLSYLTCYVIVALEVIKIITY